MSTPGSAVPSVTSAVPGPTACTRYRRAVRFGQISGRRSEKSTIAPITFAGGSRTSSWKLNLGTPSPYPAVRLGRARLSGRHSGELGQPGHARPNVLGQTLPGSGDGGGAGQFRWDASRVERDTVRPVPDGGMRGERRRPT